MGKKAIKQNDKQSRNNNADLRTKLNDINPYQKNFFEENLKIILAVILFILFLLLFASVAWYFLTQLDTALVNNPKTTISFFNFL